MANNSISIENAQAFEKALQSMPTLSILKTLVFEASTFAQARASRRPSQMGATPGTSGKHSTGNVPTPGRTYYQRGKGARYVPVKTGKTRRAGSKRSEDLAHSWRRNRNADSTVVEVLTGVSYAGRVQGGADSARKQTRVMNARGWETVDDVAVAVEDNIGKVMRNTVARLYQQWISRHGISSTVSGT
jgi:hypothetical protein